MRGGDGKGVVKIAVTVMCVLGSVLKQEQDLRDFDIIPSSSL